MATASNHITSNSELVEPNITNHIFTIAHPQYPYFLSQIVHLRSQSGSSLFVHCTSISSTTARSLLPSASSNNLTNASISDTDVQFDAEIAAALVSSDRCDNPSQQSAVAIAPIGNLASDFALAISSRLSSSSSSLSNLSSMSGYKLEPMATCISTTTTVASTSSLANSMSKRLATKLNLSQLFLSLDIPQALLPLPGRVQNSQDSKALLMIEKAIRDACISILNSL
ncbi:uncharacterized protein MEPE_03295 [Melanopsichium pennsylvanicum]|uniref:Uncharacterized protein n=1 Tax=Melanopsichium pennsylvanicum TaxID=63383 RepID=A0AAJ5C5C3_9BASI|nr:uncharacterized protein MEPE_03295 [Melanopsichium pennsylvanicum]